MKLAIAVLCGALPLAAQSLPRPDRMGVTSTGPYDYGVMGPPATPAIVAAANQAVTAAMPKGPFVPTWESLAANYRTPAWFEDAKFGIFMHWGIYSVAAHHNEWYEKHMYAADAAWHAQRFGPQETFGYKDLIPMFTVAKWDPDAWAALFRKSGARMVMGMAQHHDNFAMWDSALTPFNAKKMGPHRDVIGDLGAAVRRHGMKFALSNHGVENFTFINPAPGLKTDLFDPEWAAFYNVADRSDAAMTRFLTDWVNRNFELIDRYRPDMLWFDNGANLRLLDPLKLRIAAYYYNRAREWGQDVSLSTKFNCYAPSNDDTKQIASIVDFEKVGTRSPAGIRPGPWMVDDPIGNSWGYIDGLKLASAESVIARLIDTVSKGGFYLFNISPTAEGLIPQDQQDVLLKVGAWLEGNGDAIYGTRPWTRFADDTFHFTAKGDTIYAIAARWPGSDPSISGVPQKLRSVTLLRHGPLEFTQQGETVRIQLPHTHSPAAAWVFTLTSRQ